MPDVPQFVLKRLKETVPVAGWHPDADLLTAFAEQSLAGDERGRVMEHLAVCGDCRDVVALALPETEIVDATASVPAPRIGWLSWPALRWGAMAAGILAVISVGIVEYSHRNQQQIVASNQVKETVTAPLGLSQPVASQATIPQVEMKKKELATSSSEILNARKPAPTTSPAVQPRNFARNGVGVGSGIGAVAGIGSGAGGGSSNSDALAQASQNPVATGAQLQNPAPELRQQVKVGAMSETVEVSGASGQINTESATINQNVVAQNQANLPLQGRSFVDMDVVKAKDPVSGQAATAPAPQLATPGPLQTSANLMVRALPRWTVSSSGVLQRSFDGGNTWENVNPALSDSYHGQAMMAARAATADAAKSAEQSVAKQDRKVPSAPSPAPIFRAVAAAGLEVWAGGSGGALYHTSDGGNHWTRVMPSDPRVALTGDVLSIQFSDPQNGRISTSTAELWTTSDGGQTWRKQQ
jgi:Photosynthesis system II assembly factor YCF48/Putative zinc-finger